MGKVHDVIERVLIKFHSKIPISFPHFTHTHTGTHTHTDTCTHSTYNGSSLVQECNIGSTKLVYIACALTS